VFQREGLFTEITLLRDGEIAGWTWYPGRTRNAFGSGAMKHPARIEGGTLKAMIAWAVVTRRGKVVNWKCLSDGDEGLEIHRTRRLAQCSTMAGERIVKVKIECAKKARA
jgi:hypothetical protein